jgi:hypothetical protein
MTTYHILKELEIYSVLISIIVWMNLLFLLLGKIFDKYFFFYIEEKRALKKIVRGWISGDADTTAYLYGSEDGEEFVIEHSKKKLVSYKQYMAKNMHRRYFKRKREIIRLLRNLFPNIKFDSRKIEFTVK